MINNSYSIHKFGGSSLANAERFMAVKSLLKGDEIIIVSAVQNVTLTLQNILDKATRSVNYRHALEELEEKHLMIIKKLSLEGKSITRLIQADIFKLQDILYAVYLTGAYSRETQNLILSYGEQWSAMILKEYLAQENKVAFLDASTVLFIYEKDGSIGIDWKKSKKALDKYLQLNSDFKSLVITGFIASTLEGQKTILGRNGSDFSAAIFANLFQANSLTIWTDVDGIYTADPNIVKDAFLIETLSYSEALELAYFGAKVLHPMTIAPIVEQQIPIYIKNSFNPENKGTCILGKPKPSSELIKGISCIDKVALINIEGSGLISVSSIASRVFEILKYTEINVLFISQASSEHSICLAIPANFAKKANDVLLENLQFDIERKYIRGIYCDLDCSILSIVGDNMIGAIGIMSKLSVALAKANINIRAISQGSSERNISLIIKDKDVNKAIQAIHSGFYLSKKILSIGLIGPGLVGQSLLKQLGETINQLSRTNQIHFFIRGIINSQKMLLLDEPIDLRHWQDYFNKYAIEANMEKFLQHIASANCPNTAVIDCTANPQIAMLYQSFMERGIHVITPNKHANAGDLTYYQKLQQLAIQNRHYFYEATVCAGLPVISTLQDLIKTGDTIESIEGIFSGTLSFIFNEMDKGKSFSAAVMQAKSLGFTEPDPREDLSGMDVARKLVCLAREIGHNVNVNDVVVQNLIPSNLQTCNLEEFLAKLPLFDQEINTWVAEAQSKNQRLYYSGKISKDGELKVTIQSLPIEHPFSSLQGTDNIILFRTKRYRTHPLIIQGPGAGAEVTAAGIFSDLLRLASIL
ncbi:bifunctional aspartate kinase/homoserine dehydrogenase I [Legionella gresilensis]|uniref:bifunctional aspartate kinase/homoserine dehydrogenase I n=1 Tax=Legionella gresilensis TaxID=91823 RepID=UPI0010410BC9|nr:bifunctional aspartate kinase/homoserine dehydrogenase I [Legionella gresilensis]